MNSIPLFFCFFAFFQHEKWILGWMIGGRRWILIKIKWIQKWIPEGVYQYVYDHSTEATGEFYTLSENSLSEADTKEYLTFRKLNYLRTIKNCVLFFTVLAAVGIAGFLISLIAGAAALR